MDREQIIQWAREVGFDVLLPAEHTFGRGGVYTCSDDEISEPLEAFAKLVAAHERKAIAAMVKPLDESLADEILARGQ